MRKHARKAAANEKELEAVLFAWELNSPMVSLSIQHGLDVKVSQQRSDLRSLAYQGMSDHRAPAC